METAREAEATAQTELDKQKEVEKEAQARLPELHQKFLKIEEAQEKKEQIDMAIRADVGRYEELSVWNLKKFWIFRNNLSKLARIFNSYLTIIENIVGRNLHKKLSKHTIKFNNN